MTNRLKPETKLLSVNTWFKKDSVKLEIETMERRVQAMYQRFQASLLCSPPSGSLTPRLKINILANVHRNVLVLRQELQANAQRGVDMLTTPVSTAAPSTADGSNLHFLLLALPFLVCLLSCTSSIPCHPPYQPRTSHNQHRHPHRR
jgi:hypothetical protein